MPTRRPWVTTRRRAPSRAAGARSARRAGAADARSTRRDSATRTPCSRRPWSRRRAAAARAEPHRHRPSAGRWPRRHWSPPRAIPAPWRDVGLGGVGHVGLDDADRATAGTLHDAAEEQELEEFANAKMTYRGARGASPTISAGRRPNRSEKRPRWARSRATPARTSSPSATRPRRGHRAPRLSRAPSRGARVRAAVGVEGDQGKDDEARPSCR